MSDKKVSRSVPILGTIDERTESIAYQGDAYAGRFLMIAVLFYAALRGYLYHEYTWGWLAIVIIAGAISIWYQIKHKIYPGKRWAMLVFATLLVSGILVFILVNILALLRNA